LKASTKRHAVAAGGARYIVAAELIKSRCDKVCLDISPHEGDNITHASLLLGHSVFVVGVKEESNIQFALLA
jgi:drug/metabolite transporter superfamily protein YnfA